MTPPPIPEPRLRRLQNWTPFAVFQCDKMGVGRRFFDTVVVKGTFAIAPGALALAEAQAPIALADTYWDNAAAERSSLRHAGEVVLCKPSTDLIITGAARAPGGAPRAGWEVAVAVRRRGEVILEHRLQVTGPRSFRHHGARGWALLDPEPAAEVPVRYELAYGGAYLDRGAPEGEERWIVHEPNPSGTGFFDEEAMDPARDYPAPQWQPVDEPVPCVNKAAPLAGLGPVARPWTARLGFAGTYDEAWERAARADIEAGLPADYAADFDPRFFQCAHPALVAPGYLAGDEEIALTGLLAGEGPYALRLPGKRVAALLIDGAGGAREERLPLDTVHLDLDRGLASLCWRLTLDQGRDIRAARILMTEGA